MNKQPTLRVAALVLVAFTILTVPLVGSGQSILTNWDGGNNTEGVTPPDPHGAAGPLGIIGTYNVSVTYYNKGGGIIWGPTNLQNFFAAAGNTGQGLSDPKVLYDRYTGRFFLIHQETTTANHSFLNIAVSKNSDPQSASAADWAKYRLEMTDYSGGTTNGGDYPGFGLDSQGVYVTYNMFAMTNGIFGGSSLYSRLFIFNKAALVAGGPLSFSSTNLNGATLQPATPLDTTSPANRLYLIQSRDRTNLVLWAVNDPLGARTVSSTTLAIPDNGGGATNKAPQAGVTNVVDVADLRAQATVYLRGSVWLAITAGPAAGPSQVYYYRVNPNDYPTASPVLLESGPLGEAGYWNYQPALGGNFVGDMAVVYTRSSTNANPAMLYCFRSGTDAAFGSPQVVINSGGPSVTTGSQPWRWGDFAAVSADPEDGTLWITHEYARSGAANNWGTWFAQISVPHPSQWVGPTQTLTFSGNSSMGTNGYEIAGGVTIFQDDGSASGILLRGDGGTLQLLDSATADAATISVEGGMGNGGPPGHLLFAGNSTAAAAGIVNQTGVLGPNFKNASPNPTAGLGGETHFLDSALAGTARIANAAAAFGSGYDNAITSFEGSSSADHAVLLNYGVSATTSGYAYGGVTEFADAATAGSGTFTNFNSNNGTPYSQGRTVFFGSSSAGNGTFVNVGGDGGFLETGGTTEFRSNSIAANGTFINQGSTGGNFPGPGKTQFFDHALAGTGHFTNLLGVAPGAGGVIEFYGHASADHGVFVNTTEPAINGNAGSITFNDDSTADFSIITHLGYAGGATEFRNRSTAGQATITLAAHPNYNNSRVEFWDSSTAANAVITTGSDGTLLQFYGNSSAGNATITIGGNANFADASTAGNANITVLGSQAAGDGAGSLGFTGAASPGNANFTVQGATVNAFGASGGAISFDYGSDAGAATFTVNGGSNGGPGGRMTFGRGGSGPQARVIVNAGGTVTAGSARIGSLAGAGNVVIWLGGLWTGSRNENTELSGVIVNGYSPQDPLTKEGTGTLVLSGTNTYTGLTTISGGTVSVNGSIKGDVQVNAGTTLKGTGAIGGSVTVAPGGIVAPGNSPGTLTIAGNYSQAPQALLEVEVAGSNPSAYDHLVVHGNTDLNGKLLLVFSGYGPAATDTFTVVQSSGTLNVSNLEIIVLGLKPGYQPNYQVSAGNLIITATSSGQLRTVADSIQALPPLFNPQSGFVYSVFTLAGLTYQFDTSTDLKSWTPVSEIAGANVLVQFRHIPATTDSYRFYRVIQKSGTSAVISRDP